MCFYIKVTLFYFTFQVIVGSSCNLPGRDASSRDRKHNQTWNNDFEAKFQTDLKSAHKLTENVILLEERHEDRSDGHAHLQAGTRLRAVEAELGVAVDTDGVFFKQEDNYNNTEHNDQPMGGKKRRLDHLTWEEKLQRK